VVAGGWWGWSVLVDGGWFPVPLFPCGVVVVVVGTVAVVYGGGRPAPSSAITQKSGANNLIIVLV